MIELIKAITEVMWDRGTVVILVIFFAMAGFLMYNSNDMMVKPAKEIVDTGLKKSYWITTIKNECWVVEKRIYGDNPAIYDSTFHADDLDICIKHLRDTYEVE